MPSLVGAGTFTTILQRENALAKSSFRAAGKMRKGRRRKETALVNDSREHLAAKPLEQPDGGRANKAEKQVNGKAVKPCRLSVNNPSSRASSRVYSGVPFLRRLLAPSLARAD